ncbi:hypothetical protein NQZ68_039838, partial [Dissostichus eleginoides]
SPPPEKDQPPPVISISRVRRRTKKPLGGVCAESTSSLRARLEEKFPSKVSCGPISSTLQRKQEEVAAAVIQRALKLQDPKDSRSQTPKYSSSQTPKDSSSQTLKTPAPRPLKTPAPRPLKTPPPDPKDSSSNTLKTPAARP